MGNYEESCTLPFTFHCWLTWFSLECNKVRMLTKKDTEAFNMLTLLLLLLCWLKDLKIVHFPQDLSLKVTYSK